MVSERSLVVYPTINETTIYGYYVPNFNEVVGAYYFCFICLMATLFVMCYNLRSMQVTELKFYMWIS